MELGFALEFNCIRTSSVYQIKLEQISTVRYAKRLVISAETCDNKPANACI